MSPAAILNFPIIASPSLRLNVISKIINAVNLLVDLHASCYLFICSTLFHALGYEFYRT
jgi:hypothetical protein